MVQQNLPDLKKKQKILHGNKTTPEELKTVGQQFLQAGWTSDAIDFFAKAGHTGGLESIRDQAIEEGDVFLFRRCIRFLKTEAKEEQWQTLGDKALERGKHQFAREAYRMAGNRKAMDQVDRIIQPPEDNEVVSAVFQGSEGEVENADDAPAESD